MRFLLTLISILGISSTFAHAAPAYISLSFGSSYEDHSFDVWNGPNTTGRRALTAQAWSSDYALGFGFRDAVRLGGRRFDLDLEVFERSNTDFTATGDAGNHPTTIRTTSMLASLWTQVTGDDDWSLKAGAGVGARHSKYRMTGPSIGFTTTDRAPYAMIGLRLSKRATERTQIFSEIRAHMRPPIHSGGGAMQGPLEHNSMGLTLRLGLQINLSR